jgi:hypothetical protein
MALTVNGVEVTLVQKDGVDLEALHIDGVEVWTLESGDHFSVIPYTGTGAAFNVPTGVDLSESGMIWFKGTGQIDNHYVFSPEHGIWNFLITNATNPIGADGSTVTSFNTDSVDIGGNPNMNTIGLPYVAWSFKSKAKFFDVVEFVGTGAVQAIPHDLGVQAGMLIIKSKTKNAPWYCQHVSRGGGLLFQFNQNTLEIADTSFWNGTAMTDTSFTVGTNVGVNESAQEYTAYLFAHDVAVDGQVQCGQYVGTGASGLHIELGWKPRYILIKSASVAGHWNIMDSTRGMAGFGADDYVQASNLNAGDTVQDYVNPVETGFDLTSANGQVNQLSSTYIYVAIREAPPVVPTLPPEYDSTINGALISDNTYGYRVSGSIGSIGIPTIITPTGTAVIMNCMGDSATQLVRFIVDIAISEGYGIRMAVDNITWVDLPRLNNKEFRVTNANLANKIVSSAGSSVYLGIQWYEL